MASTYVVFVPPHPGYSTRGFVSCRPNFRLQVLWLRFDAGCSCCSHKGKGKGRELSWEENRSWHKVGALCYIDGAARTSDIRDTAGTGRGRACVEVQGSSICIVRGMLREQSQGDLRCRQAEGATARFPSHLSWVTIQHNATRRRLLEFLPPVCPGPQCMPLAAVRELGSGSALTRKARVGLRYLTDIRTCQTATRCPCWRA